VPDLTSDNSSSSEGSFSSLPELISYDDSSDYSSDTSTDCSSSNSDSCYASAVSDLPTSSSESSDFEEVYLPGDQVLNDSSSSAQPIIYTMASGTLEQPGSLQTPQGNHPKVRINGPENARKIPNVPVGRCSLLTESIKLFNHFSGDSEEVCSLFDSGASSSVADADLLSEIGAQPLLTKNNIEIVSPHGRSSSHRWFKIYLYTKQGWCTIKVLGMDNLRQNMSASSMITPKKIEENLGLPPDYFNHGPRILRLIIGAEFPSLKPRELFRGAVSSKGPIGYILYKSIVNEGYILEGMRVHSPESTPMIEKARKAALMATMETSSLQPEEASKPPLPPPTMPKANLPKRVELDTNKHTSFFQNEISGDMASYTPSKLDDLLTELIQVENAFSKIKCQACGTAKPDLPEEDVIQRTLLEGMVNFDETRGKLKFQANFIIDEDKICDLADNSASVKARSNQLHKKFIKRSAVDRRNFNEALNKCAAMGGIVPITAARELDLLPKHWLPLDEVSSGKQSSSPSRPVFDASQQAPGSPSFNDIHAIGHNCTFIT
jgi:hypothetical protein